MMNTTMPNHATVKERPVSTLDQKPARAEGRKDPWSQLLEKVGKNQDRQAYHALFEHFGPQIKYYAMPLAMA